jgi:hypothetical protein
LKHALKRCVVARNGAFRMLFVALVGCNFWRSIVGKIAVRVADDQRRGLKQLAQRTQFSRSDLIRIAINKLLENPEWLPGWVAEQGGRGQQRAGA